MVDSMASRPVIVGEVLYDMLPARDPLLGGAPFNVAWNLRGLGLDPVLISRVGRDDLGAASLEAMRAWGLDTTGIQIDPQRPTGTVQVALDAGIPRYQILADQAYDFIELDLALQAISPTHCGLLYHGTLATRLATARQMLRALRQASGLPIFLDLNLRDPWWDAVWVEEALAAARWAKLTNEELGVALNQAVPQPMELMGRLEGLRQRWHLRMLMVTMGAAGSLLAAPNRIIGQAAIPVSNLADTVGAGDAFSAVAILAIVKGWPPAVMLRRASEFASAVCQIPGAICQDPQFYQAFAWEWELEDQQIPQPD